MKTIDNIIKQTLQSLDKRSFWTKQKILLFKELGNLLHWGVGIAEGLQIIHHNTNNYAVKQITEVLWYEIHHWKRLSQALKKFPNYFDETDISTIKSWEQSGRLDEILLMLSWEYSYLNSLKQKVIGALTYPAILVTVAIGAVVALFIFILPAVFEIANEFDAHELPRVTRTLKNFSEYLVSHGLNLGLILLFIVFVLFVFFSSRSWQKKLYAILFNIPVIWKMLKAYFLIRFSRYTKMLIESWINYIDIFKMLKNIMPQPIFEDFFDQIIQGLTTGKTMYDSINGNEILIPNQVAALIKVGEQTASLIHTFDSVIDMYQEELDYYITNLSKFTEPIMLIFIGWIVIMIALGVFGVIMNIMDSVSV